ncbi:MAG TPA: T9SS type A sorting domain-containing protein, partial [Bacteroidales bacterium]|nr:T9SS type A sorting domain-containing protein [Bacteroidales bacterium]
IGNLLHDTLSPDASDSAYLLISQSQQLSHKYMRAVMAFEIGDTSMVAQLMDEIGGTFYPDGLLPAEHQKSLNFYNEFKSMGLLNIPVKSIDSTQAVLLMAGLANNTLPDCWVRNLLTAAGRYSFEEQYILPDELKNTDIQPERVKNINGSTIFKVFPNPANQYAVFEYSLKDGEIMASSCIQITDTQGKPYGCLSLKRPQDQVIFSTHNLKPGLYLCRLMNGGKTIKSIKLSLVR